MAGFTWTVEEKIIAVWLASVGIDPAVIARVLSEKNYSRTMIAVREQVNKIRVEYNLGNASNELNLERVDEWVRDVGRDLDLNGLLRPTLKDQEIIKQKSPDLDILSHFSLRIDNPNRMDYSTQ
jgi:hypothetical protein